MPKAVTTTSAKRRRQPRFKHKKKNELPLSSEHCLKEERLSPNIIKRTLQPPAESVLGGSRAQGGDVRSLLVQNGDLNASIELMTFKESQVAQLWRCRHALSLRSWLDPSQDFSAELKKLHVVPTQELRAEYSPLQGEGQITREALLDLSSSQKQFSALLSSMKLGEVSSYFLIDPPGEFTFALSQSLFGGKQISSCGALVLTIGCWMKSLSDFRRAEAMLNWSLSQMVFQGLPPVDGVAYQDQLLSRQEEIKIQQCANGFEAAFLLACFSDCRNNEQLNDILSASLDWLCRVLFVQKRHRKVVEVAEALQASPRFMDLELQCQIQILLNKSKALFLLNEVKDAYFELEGVHALHGDLSTDAQKTIQTEESVLHLHNSIRALHLLIEEKARAEPDQEEPEEVGLSPQDLPNEEEFQRPRGNPQDMALISLVC